MNGIENIAGAYDNIRETGEGLCASRISGIQMEYLEEAISTNDPEMVVNRIDELTDRVPPKAIDSNPEISEKIESIKESIDNKYLEAPGDLEQVSLISERMTKIEGARFEEWQTLTPQQRLEAMQQVENIAADIEHRPACVVKGESLGEGYFGYFNPQDKTITLNIDYLNNSYEAYSATLDTIIHEGRHAYQHYNVDERQVHPSDGDCTNWSKNLHENLWGMFPENIGYQSPQEVGFERYWMQPVEADARAFAEDVINKFNQMA